MIDGGEVAIEVLGWPNYPVKDDSLIKYSQQCPVTSEMSLREEDCVMYTRKGSGKAWMQPLIHSDKRLEWQNSARNTHVASIEDPALATFCEPVERSNSNHSFAAGIANTLGLRSVMHYFMLLEIIVQFLAFGLVEVKS
ncbi:PAP-specific phosphatase HAL2-like [Olea europaea subsp. europaea]|uniref:PAP-specific phosphatase HAL2-like n=1 Tax=Olea europaea subsp. europaea TaxID=158383 RepID=A0A8S0RAL7_OLEEU|nr:PAP-specific phosphatase HAL2-like [Olea europaea subsp. europaea]